MHRKVVNSKRLKSRKTFRNNQDSLIHFKALSKWKKGCTVNHNNTKEQRKLFSASSKYLGIKQRKFSGFHAYLTAEARRNNHKPRGRRKIPAELVSHFVLHLFSTAGRQFCSSPLVTGSRQFCRMSARMLVLQFCWSHNNYFKFETIFLRQQNSKLCSLHTAQPSLLQCSFCTLQSMAEIRAEIHINHQIHIIELLQKYHLLPLF